MRLTTSWMEEGIEAGKMEGHTEEAQRLALMQLRLIIGSVTERQEIQVRRLRLQELEELSGALLDLRIREWSWL